MFEPGTPGTMESLFLVVNHVPPLALSSSVRPSFSIPPSPSSPLTFIITIRINMLSDLASEVLKKTENHSPKFVLEKTVMEKSCFLTVEWPIQRFSIRIHNNKPIVVKSLLEATSIFCTALCNTGLQSTFVKVVHKQSLRTWSSVGLLYRSSDSLLDFESVCNWIKRYVLRKHHIPPSLGPHSDEDFSSQPASPNTRLTNYPIDPPSLGMHK